MTEEHLVKKIAEGLQLKLPQVKATVQLLDEGGTVPFISRYRKERTGSLDEVEITDIRDQITRLREIEKRREFILKTIGDQENLTPELEKKIKAAETLHELEDLYLPYKPKRRTKATIAREKGLEPLAKQLFNQENIDPEAEAENYINEEKKVTSAEDALQGARDIIAEMVNENPEAREKMRELFDQRAVIKSKVLTGKEEEGSKYKDYFEWEELLSKTPSHRLLAMRRGEREMFLTLDIAPPKDDAVSLLESHFIEANNKTTDHIKLAIEDSYKRLLKPSMETEFRLNAKKSADEQAIGVFADNLRELLLTAPFGEKSILAIDPGFRTGCKVVALNKQGKLLEHTAIYPNAPQHKTAESEATVKTLIEKYNIEAIAIGNGTASRETEQFFRNIGLDNNIQIVMVNESGASIYSASAVAREEFPDEDVTVRGAVSIGRRMADPLAELVKLDPKSIGVGQYQHDVDQNDLKKSLDQVVESCVNAVGVEVNTASKQLMTYVAGLGPQLADNIVKYRNENGPFQSRKDLLKVPRMGEKAFEQAAGFLRIREAKNPLDSSAVHPERYPLVDKMAKDLKTSVTDLVKNVTLQQKINVRDYVSEDAGLPTLQDIMEELAKPGRDPRQQFEAFQFAEGVHEVDDLRPGMSLPGIVTNVTKFGAFVDIGVHQDGLVHISEMADRFVSDPAQVVKIQQKVNVTVLDVDAQRKRIALSMKSGSDNAPAKKTKAQKKKKEAPEDIDSKLSMLKGKWSS